MYRPLKVELNSCICLEEWQCIKNVEYLYLDKLHGFMNVVHELHGEGFAQLKHLRLRLVPCARLDCTLLQKN